MDDFETLKEILSTETSRKELTQAGHRSRVKAAVDKDPDFSTFSDHEILEYVLFATNAQKDTKGIARDLINTFGSYSAVLRATPHELMRVANIGERTARLLTAILPAARRAEEARMRNQVFLPDPNNAAKFLAPLFLGHAEETIQMVSIDTNDRVIQTDCLASGRPGEVTMDIQKMINVATRNSAAKILIAHNHPAGSLVPSLSDIDVTCRVVIACSLIGILFVDHIIFANDRYFSFLGNQIMDTVYSRCDEALGTKNIQEFRQRKKALGDRYMKESEKWDSLLCDRQMETLSELYTLCRQYEAMTDKESEKKLLEQFMTGIVHMAQDADE